MIGYVLVAAGGALGSIIRYWISERLDDRLNAALPQLMFPVGTLLVNVLGSFAIGLLAGMAEGGSRLGMTDGSRLLLMVGLCGGFTTFSSFSLQTLGLLREGLLLRAGGNAALSVLLCLLATWAGLALVQAIGRPVP